MTTSPRPARVAAPQLPPRPRSPAEEGSDREAEPDAPRQKNAMDERARILQEYAARQRGLAPPVKRQRRMDKGDAATAPAAEDQASTAASTPAGSAVAAASVEVVAVMENVAVAVVAQEEKRLEGAPEGELFLVNVLTSAEFQPSASLEDELRELDELLAVLDDAKQTRGWSSNGDEGDVSWGRQYAAVDSVRRLALHHSDEAQSRLSRALALLVLPSASSLRSAMSRNALLCLQDLVCALPADVASHFDTIVPILVQRACNEKQFIRDTAKDVLDTTVKVTPNESLLASLLQGSADKNPQAVSMAGLYASKVITTLDSDRLKAFAGETHPAFLEELSVFLNCKVVQCKMHARKSLQYTRKTIGDTKFVAMVKARLTGGAQLDVLKASEERKKAGGPKGRPSIRERMLQMKKAKAAAERKQTADDVPVMVAAAPTPAEALPSSSDPTTRLSSSL